MLRHERMSVAISLAEKLHHSSRGQRMARAGEEESEMNYTVTIRTTPPPSRSSSVCSRRSPAVPGHPVWVRRGGHRIGSCRTPSSCLPTSCPWFRSLTFLWCWGGDRVMEVLRKLDVP